ncbi:integration host factor, actinobacterial type [Rhodococcus tibetensis]|uniref:integration host factor, actinobacterial type n=1 Tax=Rhodococcus tibetensis TaxID=2965064 RepID=UPI0035AC2777
MPLPQLTAEDRASALTKANAVRRDRALLKEDLKKGRTDVATIVARADTDDIAGTMKVIDLLASLPGFAKVRAKTAMDELDIAETDGSAASGRTSGQPYLRASLNRTPRRAVI